MLINIARSVCLVYCLLLMAVRAVNLDIPQLLSLNIRPTAYLMFLRDVAANTVHTLRDMDVAVLGRDNAMLVIGPAPRRSMTPETHLVRGFLHTLCCLEYIYVTRSPELEVFTFFYHTPPIIGGMADQTVDILVVSFVHLSRQIWLGADRRMARTATARLRWF